MKGRDIGIVAACTALGLMCMIRGGETTVLGALFGGIVIGRLIPVIFP